MAHDKTCYTEANCTLTVYIHNTGSSRDFIDHLRDITCVYHQHWGRRCGLVRPSMHIVRGTIWPPYIQLLHLKGYVNYKIACFKRKLGCASAMLLLQMIASLNGVFCCGRWASDRGSRYANVNTVVELKYVSWGYRGVKWLRKQCCENNKTFINSLWPSETICRHKSGSTFAQIMTCCLRAPSH